MLNLRRELKSGNFLEYDIKRGFLEFRESPFFMIICLIKAELFTFLRQSIIP